MSNIMLERSGIVKQNLLASPPQKERQRATLPPHLFFPSPPRKRYIQRKPLLVGVKAMTLVGGFTCAEGVVLCADTEMTIPEWLKFSGSKMRLYRKLKCRAAFAFAGDERFCGMFMHKLARRIYIAEKEGSDLVSAVEDESLHIHKNFAGETYEAQSSLIMSLWQGVEGKRQRQLYSISEGIVNPVQQVCEGTGKGVVQGMVTELFSPTMKMKQAALLAIYILAEAKTYGYGVGKDSQILLLEHNGSWASFPEDPFYSSIKEIEEDYIRLKRLLKPILVGYSDIAVDEKAFSKILQDFGKWAANQRARRRAPYEHLIEQQIKWQENAYQEGLAEGEAEEEE